MRISDWSSDVCSSDLAACACAAAGDFQCRQVADEQQLLHRLAAMRHAIEQDDVADEHGIAAAQPLMPDAGGEDVRVDMGADVVARVSEGRRVLHYRAQRTVYHVALARRNDRNSVVWGQRVSVRFTLG